MNSGGITAVSICFWVFLAIVSVAGIIQDYRKRKLALEPISKAIEHGQQLSPEVIDRLLGREQHPEQQAVDPRHLAIGGIITCASGVGLALLGIFFSMIQPLMLWIGFGVGATVACIGIGLIISAKYLQR